MIELYNCTIRQTGPRLYFLSGSRDGDLKGIGIVKGINPSEGYAVVHNNGEEVVVRIASYADDDARKAIEAASKALPPPRRLSQRERYELMGGNPDRDWNRGSAPYLEWGRTGIDPEAAPAGP
jgi:hypothetical protein